MKKTHLGLANIAATVICDSVNANGDRITTLEIEYPRFILAELNTHRMLSKNSSSSRAIPTNRILERLITEYAYPVEWGKNQPGMQSSEQISKLDQLDCDVIWQQARDDMIYRCEELLEHNVHKQVVNRLTEPFQVMKTVVTATEWPNFFYLRNHRDAQPEFQELARVMQQAINSSTPQTLIVGEWHLPYVDVYRENNKTVYSVSGQPLTLEQAQWISSSCCAQVSYRRLDQSLEKAQDIYNRLIWSDPPHMSPTEHQATPMPSASSNRHHPWPEGVTHRDREGRWWSGNFRGWIQYRKTLPNEAKW